MTESPIEDARIRALAGMADTGTVRLQVPGAWPDLYLLLDLSLK